MRAGRIRTVSIWGCVAAGVITAGWSLFLMAAYIRDDCRAENNEGYFIAHAVVALAISAFWLLGRNWLRGRKTWVFGLAVFLSILLAFSVSFSAAWINAFENWHGCDHPGGSLIY